MRKIFLTMLCALTLTVSAGATEDPDTTTFSRYTTGSAWQLKGATMINDSLAGGTPGWYFTKAIDLSAYKYLVICAKSSCSAQSTQVTITDADGNSIGGDDYKVYAHNPNVEYDASSKPTVGGNMWLDNWNNQCVCVIELDWLKNQQKFADAATTKVSKYVDITNIRSLYFNAKGFYLGKVFLSNTRPTNGAWGGCDYSIDNINSANQYATVCLGYSAVCCNADVYEAEGVDNVNTPDILKLKKYNGIMEAGKPYIVKSRYALTDYTKLTRDNTLRFFKAGPATATTAVAGNNGLTGVLARTAMTASTSQYVVKDNSLVLNDIASTLDANRAYYDITGATASTTTADATIPFSSEITSSLTRFAVIGDDVTIDGSKTFSMRFASGDSTITGFIPARFNLFKSGTNDLSNATTFKTTQYDGYNLTIASSIATNHAFRLFVEYYEKDAEQTDANLKTACYILKSGNNQGNFTSTETSGGNFALSTASIKNVYLTYKSTNKNDIVDMDFTNCYLTLGGTNLNIKLRGLNNAHVLTGTFCTGNGTSFFNVYGFNKYYGGCSTSLETGAYKYLKLVLAEASQGTITATSGDSKRYTFTSPAGYKTYYIPLSGANYTVGYIRSDYSGEAEVTGVWLTNTINVSNDVAPIYSRTVTANNYGTICLPYAAKAASDVTVYSVESKSTDGKTIHLKNLGTGAEMSIGVPYLFKSTSTTANFYVNGLCTGIVAQNTNGLYGNYDAATVENNTTTPNYVLKNNAWYRVDKDNFKSAQYHAYVKLSEVTAASEAKSVADMDVIDGEATGINTATISDSDQNVYSLQGVKMNATKLPKGIYIKAGKKFISK